MSNKENTELNQETMGAGAETAESLNLTDSIKINESLTINFYEGGLIGLDHFNFEDEVLLKKESMKKISEVFSLYEKEQDLTKALNNAGFKR